MRSARVGAANQPVEEAGTADGDQDEGDEDHGVALPCGSASIGASAGGVHEGDVLAGPERQDDPALEVLDLGTSSSMLSKLRTCT